MLDTYIIGHHNRQSPEANVPLVNYTETEHRMGGAANVALNLHTLGLIPHLISTIGQDENGQTLEQLCQKALPKATLLALPNRPTTTKTRVVTKDYKQLLRLDRETTNPLTTNEIDQIKTQIATILKAQSIAALVIQDYNKGLCTPELIEYIQHLSQIHKIPLFVDPKKDHFKLLSQCTLFKPNLKELSTQLERQIAPKVSDISAALKELGLERAPYTFVTLADKGIYYRYAGGLMGQAKGVDMGQAKGGLKCAVNSHRDLPNVGLGPVQEGIIPGEKIDEADVSGAGDSVLAMLIKAYLAGGSVTEMTQLANKTGALACQKRGVSAIKASEIEDIQ